jgi:hypothetical protein
MPTLFYELHLSFLLEINNDASCPLNFVSRFDFYLRGPDFLKYMTFNIIL